MGYLDNDTIVVDAILTKHGRKLLAEGAAINPSHFALSDDGIDYTLWNTSSPSGSSGYDDYISKLPMIEAVSDDASQMRYSLMSLPQNTRYLPVVTLPNSPNTNNLYTLDNDVTSKKEHVLLEPAIQNYSETNPRFDFKIMDATAIDYDQHDGSILQTAGTHAQPQEQSTPFSVTITGATYVQLIDKTVSQTHKTAIHIQHVGTGAQIVAYVQVLKSDDL